MPYFGNRTHAVTKAPHCQLQTDSLSRGACFKQTLKAPILEECEMRLAEVRCKYIRAVDVGARTEGQSRGIGLCDYSLLRNESDKEKGPGV